MREWAWSCVCCTRGEAERVITRRRDPAADPPWAGGYPLDGDTRAAAAYVSHLPISGGGDAWTSSGTTRCSRTGWWSAASASTGRRAGMSSRSATASFQTSGGVVWPLRRCAYCSNVAAGLEGVRRVVGRTEDSNVASQRVMLAAGMRLVGRDPDFLHFEIDLQGGAAAGGRQAGAGPGDQRR